MAKRDYYEVLGVKKDASADEIKRAYRKHALEHHPDRGGTAEKFKEFNEAYETLKDPQKRTAYDQFGHTGAQGFGGPGGAGFGQGFDFNVDLDLGDIFSNFFGGAQNRQSAGTRQTAKGRDIQVEVVVDFKEAVFGVTRNLIMDMEDVCERCGGRGAEPDSKLEACKTCGGSGRVVSSQRTILGTIQQTKICSRCDGRGEVPEKLCKDCRGVGTLERRREINVKIPAGIQDGATVRIGGQGGAVANGHRGDLYLFVHVKAHPRFGRHGLDITSEQLIDMITATLGGEIEVETIDGPIKMKVPAGTQPGTVFKLNGHGVPYRAGEKRGNHLVALGVAIPRRLTPNQKHALEELQID